jgi:hypothetical protein
MKAHLLSPLLPASPSLINREAQLRRPSPLLPCLLSPSPIASTLSAAAAHFRPPFGGCQTCPFPRKQKKPGTPLMLCREKSHPSAVHVCPPVSPLNAHHTHARVTQPNTCQGTRSWWLPLCPLLAFAATARIRRSWQPHRPTQCKVYRNARNLPCQ